MKRFLFVLLFSFFTLVSLANHTKGGWMYYEYLGPGVAANSSIYRITLKLYTECTLNPGQTDANVPFTFFNASTNAEVYNISVPVISDINTNNCTTVECHPCINNIPSICYKIRTYQTVIELPNTPEGFIVAYQRCCRITGIQNIQAPSNSVGETWTIKIPGTAIAGAQTNSSARFSQNDTAIICQGGYFTFDFSATDINNDSLVYAFTPAYGGASNTAPAPPNASSPPYASVPYSGGFSGTQPLGSGVTINSNTGIVSGTGPALGIYVITVTVSEYKRGTNIKIAEVRKSLHIEVANCSSTAAVLNPRPTTCDGFTISFKNDATNNPEPTYYWDFGDTSTSTQITPTHTYTDTGIYVLKLVVNRGLACSDSTTTLVKVYPGFFPDFTMAGQCQNTPVQFADITTATYGIPDIWNWNFGDPASPNNTATIKNPTHTYNTTGTYNITFIVKSSKGCVDTVLKTLDILPEPALTAPNDTLICIIDTLQFNAVGAGSFLWSPNYMISNVNIPNPLVSPDVTTTYTVALTDAFGCTASKQVKVNVKNFVTQFAGADTTICQKDSVIFTTQQRCIEFFVDRKSRRQYFK